MENHDIDSTEESFSDIESHEREIEDDPYDINKLVDSVVSVILSESIADVQGMHEQSEIEKVVEEQKQRINELEANISRWKETATTDLEKKAVESNTKSNGVVRSDLVQSLDSESQLKSLEIREDEYRQEILQLKEERNNLLHEKKILQEKLKLKDEGVQLTRINEAAQRGVEDNVLVRGNLISTEDTLRKERDEFKRMMTDALSLEKEERLSMEWMAINDLAGQYRDKFKESDAQCKRLLDQLKVMQEKLIEALQQSDETKMPQITEDGAESTISIEEELRTSQDRVRSLEESLSACEMELCRLTATLEETEFTMDTVEMKDETLMASTLKVKQLNIELRRVTGALELRESVEAQLEMIQNEMEIMIHQQQNDTLLLRMSVQDLKEKLSNREQEIARLHTTIEEKDHQHNLEENIIEQLLVSISDLEKAEKNQVGTFRRKSVRLAEQLVTLKASSKAEVVRSMDLESNGDSTSNDLRIGKRNIRTFKAIPMKASDSNGLIKEEHVVLEKGHVIERSQSSLQRDDLNRREMNRTRESQSSYYFPVGPTLDMLMLFVFATVVHALALMWVLDNKYIAETMSIIGRTSQRFTDEYIVGCDGTGRTAEYIALHKHLGEQEQELREQMVQEELLKDQLNEISDRLQNEIIGRETATMENSRILNKYDGIAWERDVLKSRIRALQNEIQQSKHDAQIYPKSDLRMEQETDNESEQTVKKQTVGEEWIQSLTNVAIGIICAVISFAAVKRMNGPGSRNDWFKDGFIVPDAVRPISQ